MRCIQTVNAVANVYILRNTIHSLHSLYNINDKTLKKKDFCVIFYIACQLSVPGETHFGRHKLEKLIAHQL